VNSAKILELIPTITASTMTLMPEEPTLPRTLSARKLFRFQMANGTRMKPARLISLNSMVPTNTCAVRMKKATPRCAMIAAYRSSASARRGRRASPPRCSLVTA